MKKYAVALMALLAVTCWVALAADIDGKWTREQPGRGGGEPTTQTLTLMAKGSTLTGSLDAGRGGAVDIKDGKIEGSDVSFTIEREFNGNSFTQMYKGTVSGNELKLTVEGGGRGGKGGGGGGGKGGGRGPQEQTWTKAK
jgi:hypothetical protein